MRRFLAGTLILVATGAALAADPVPTSPSRVTPPVAQSSDQILVQVQAIEISLTKLRALGFDVKSADGACPQSLTKLLKPDGQRRPRETISLEVVQPSGLTGLIDALRKEKIARVLAEPTLVTLDRRPAFYRLGGEIPAAPSRGARAGKPKTRTFGTEIYFVPTKLSARRLKLELRARVAHLDPKLDAIVDGQKVFGLREVAVDTGCEMDFGQTAVLAGLVQERIGPQSESSTAADAPRKLIATIFLMRPELVQADAASQSRQPTIER